MDSLHLAQQFFCCHGHPLNLRPSHIATISVGRLLQSRGPRFHGGDSDLSQTWTVRTCTRKVTDSNLDREITVLSIFRGFFSVLQETFWDIVSQICLLAESFWLPKTTTDPHILAHVTTDSPDDRYQKLKLYIAELILGSHEYISVAYVAISCTI
jgi:hypothetical protein